MARETRLEHDLLGDRQVPAAAYYGVHTLRALENFPISGTPISIYPDLVEALAFTFFQFHITMEEGRLGLASGTERLVPPSRD